jgi:exopolysaccharide biosynthesis WecB/TagA/CpsF family protein
MSAAADFLGLRFDNMSMREAIDALRWASYTPGWRYVVTPNAAHLARLRQGEPALRAIYDKAWMCVLDSRVIARCAQLVGLRPPQVVTGADLVAALLRQEIDASTKICVVGGDAVLIARLRQLFSIGSIAHINPPIGFWRGADSMAEVVDFIVGAQAPYTFLAVGSPQQEYLAAMVSARGTGRGVGICCGAALEFATGLRRRAPAVLQRLALEWAYRLCTEPRRMARRYLLESPQGVLLVLREASRRS